MKKTKNITLTIVIVIVTLLANSQTTSNIRCDQPLSVPSSGPLMCNSDFLDYAFTQPLVFNINIHVFKKSVGSGPYDSVTSNDAQFLVSLINQKYSTLTPTPQITQTLSSLPTP